MLFSGTIYDNLVMAHPHASFEDVIAACKSAEIHDTIEQLPHGYQTEIGERGTGLSGGQNQRIAIARALLKRPEDPDLRRSRLQPRPADRRALRADREFAQGQGDDALHHPPDSPGLQVDEVFSFDRSAPAAPKPRQKCKSSSQPRTHPPDSHAFRHK